jgi:Na+-driven multidrug efflux pump
MANLFYGIYYNLAIWYKLTDRTADGAKIALGGAGITIMLNILLIPVFGYEGAAWAHLICYFLMMTASFIWGQKVYPIPYQLMALAGYTAIAMCIYFLTTLINLPEQWIKMTLNSLLILAFIAFAFWSEHKRNGHILQSK